MTDSDYVSYEDSLKAGAIAIGIANALNQAASDATERNALTAAAALALIEGLEADNKKHVRQRIIDAKRIHNLQTELVKVRRELNLHLSTQKGLRSNHVDL